MQSKEIKNCVIVGRGALGLLYYAAISKVEGIEVRFAADRERVERYKGQEVSFCSEKLEGVQYFTPSSVEEVAADLVIITTKWDGYRSALDLISGIVDSHTIVLPLLNGLLAYDLAYERYGSLCRVLRGYYIGTTASRSGAEVYQSGVYTTAVEECGEVDSFFDRCGIKYQTKSDMHSAQWQKFVINIGLNQCSALDGGLNYGEIKASAGYREIVAKLMNEAESVAVAEGVVGAEGMAAYGISFLDELMIRIIALWRRM